MKLLNREWLSLASAVMGLMVVGQGAPAADVPWIPTSTGNWNTAANWNSPDGVPQASQDSQGVINNGGTAQVTSLAPDVGGVILGDDAGQTGSLSIASGGTLIVRLPTSEELFGGVPSVLGTLRVGGDGADSDGRGYFTMTSGTLGSTTHRTDIVVGGEDLATGLGRSSVTLSGNPTLHVGTASFTRNLGVTGPSVNFLASGNVTFDGSSVFTPTITGPTHSAIKTDAVANLAGNLTVNFSGVTPAQNQSWTLMEAGTFSGEFANELNDTRDIIPTGVPAPAALGEAYRLREVGAPTGGRRKLDVVYQKLLVLTVDRTTGGISIRNPLGGAISIDGYEISSAIGSMATGWNSLDDQNSSPGWEELSATVNSLSEFKPSGSFNLTSIPGGSLSLGTGFDRDAVGSVGLGLSGEDLVFQYTQPGIGPVIGHVEYTGIPYLNGLGLFVDASGVATLVNDSETVLTIDGYRIVSTTGALVPAGWNSLEDQVGSGWMAGTGSAFALAEAMPGQGASFILNPHDDFVLGDIGNFLSPADEAGLSLEFHLAGDTEVDFGRVFFLPEVAGLPGDYNNDGKVDAADYTVWRDNLGAPTEASLNGNGDGVAGVTASDYTWWKQHYGSMAPGAGAGGMAAASQVPEPSSGWLLLLGMVAILLTKFRRESVVTVVAGSSSCPSGAIEMSKQFAQQCVGRRTTRLTGIATALVGVSIGIWMASPVEAQNLITNGSFEQFTLPPGYTLGDTPPDTKIASGWNPVADPPNGGTNMPVGSDSVAWFNLPGTTPGTGVAGDSGIEIRGSGQHGMWQAYSFDTDVANGIYPSQTTSNTILSGAAYALSLSARPYFTFTEDWLEANATLHWRMYYGGTASTEGTVFAEGFFDLGTGNGDTPVANAMQPDGVQADFDVFSTIAVVPPPAAVGQVIGVSIMNSSGGLFGDPVGATPAFAGRSWVAFDSVSLEAVSTVPGDVNIDGIANLTDFQTILNNMSNLSASFWTQGDLNGDDKVDLLDFAVWKAAAYAPPPGAGGLSASVPEPSTMVLAVTFAVALGGFCVRRSSKLGDGRRVRTLASMFIGITACLAIAPATFGQYMTLPNPGFEVGFPLDDGIDPPETQKVWFWDETGVIVPGAILGWTAAGPGVEACCGMRIGDSGAEAGGVEDFDFTVGDVNHSGFLNAEDPMIYTVSSTNIVSGRNYILSLFASNIFQSDGGPARLELQPFYLSGGTTRIALGSPVVVTPQGGFSNYSVTLTAAQVVAGVGQPLGIEIDNIGNETPGRNDADLWIGIDHVQFFADNPAGGVGDVNNDGVVDITDYNTIKANFNTAVPTRTMGDISGPTGAPDLFVDLYDLRAWKDSVGSGAGGLAGGLGVPEPSSLALALILAPLFAGARSRNRTPRRLLE